MMNRLNTIEKCPRPTASKPAAHRNAGFSLIEILIVVVLLGFVLSAVVIFSLRIQNAEFVLGQRHEEADRQNLISSRLRHDFDNLGLNLTSRPANEKSGDVAADFERHEDYSVTVEDGANRVSIRRSSFNDSTPLQSNWLLMPESGGEFSFAWREKPTGEIGWRHPAKRAERSFYLYDNGDLEIIEDEKVVWNLSAAERFERLTEGDRLTISLQAGSDGNCRVLYFRVREERRELLFVSDKGCPSEELRPFIDLKSEGFLNQVEIRGNRLTPVSTDNPSAVSRALLPTFRGVRLTAPIFISSESSFSMLPTDNSIDTADLLEEVSFDERGDSRKIFVPQPLRGAYQPGDVCLLFDLTDGRSLLGRIMSVEREGDEAGSRTMIELVPAVKDRSGEFGLFYSKTEDFADYVFSTRARLVRLKFVEYQIGKSESNGVGFLSRRENDAPWEAVAYGLDKLNIVENRRNERAARQVFSVYYSLDLEDQPSTEANESVLTFVPPALNDF